MRSGKYVPSLRPELLGILEWIRIGKLQIVGDVVPLLLSVGLLLAESFDCLEVLLHLVLRGQLVVLLLAPSYPLSVCFHRHHNY